MRKSEQIKILKELGLTSIEIKTLRTSKQRNEAIAEFAIEKPVEEEVIVEVELEEVKVDKNERNKYGYKKCLYGEGFRII